MTETKPQAVQEYDENNKLIAVAPEHRGDTMAFAVQQVMYNLGGNFFEPYVSSHVQKHFAKNNSHIKAGSYGQNLGGDFAGDIIGASGLMMAEVLAPVPLHTLTRKMRDMIDPVYSTIADHVFSGQKNDPNVAQQKEEWKVAQERSFVRGTLMAVGGITGNIATQKYIIKNPAPAHVIFLGKLASSTITTALGLAIRAVFPSKTQGMDKWMSKKIFTPMFEDKDSGELSR